MSYGGLDLLFSGFNVRWIQVGSARGWDDFQTFVNRQSQALGGDVWLSGTGLVLIQYGYLTDEWIQ